MLARMLGGWPLFPMGSALQKLIYIVVGIGGGMVKWELVIMGVDFFRWLRYTSPSWTWVTTQHVHKQTQKVVWVLEDGITKRLRRISCDGDHKRVVVSADTVSQLCAL